MGTLRYGRRQQYEFDDRTLEHLRAVIVARLRRKESFFFSWQRRGGGHADDVCLWITPTIPIAFEFDSAERVRLSRAWVQMLLRSSYSEQGLVLAPEPLVGGARVEGGPDDGDPGDPRAEGPHRP